MQTEPAPSRHQVTYGNIETLAEWVFQSRLAIGVSFVSSGPIKDRFLSFGTISDLYTAHVGNWLVCDTSELRVIQSDPSAAHDFAI